MTSLATQSLETDSERRSLFPIPPPIASALHPQTLHHHRPSLPATVRTTAEAEATCSPAFLSLSGNQPIDRGCPRLIG